MEDILQEYQLKVQRTARYYSLRPNVGSNAEGWIVLHGYGFLASRFIRWFKIIAEKGGLVIAPEALSRFYLENMSEKPGASWMTSEDRLNEIEDQYNYLETLMEALQVQYPEIKSWNLLGFSQGATTAIRWFVRTEIHFKQLIIWAGGIPEESIQGLIEKSNTSKISYFYGTEDEFIPKNRIAPMIENMKTSGLQIAFHQFEGKHEIPERELLKILA